MNSPAISRTVSRRVPSSKLIMPSAGRGPPSGASSPPSNATVTGVPAAMVLAASASVRAGTSAAARSPSDAGCQGSSRTASRYRSVAAMVSVVPSKSRQTPVSMGSVSSLLAAGTTWAMAAASTPPSAAPAAAGGSGSAGNSSAGSATSVNSAPPQLRLTESASEVNSAGWGGRLRVISASRRPGTSAVPGSATSAATRTRADTS